MTTWNEIDQVVALSLDSTTSVFDRTDTTLIPSTDSNMVVKLQIDLYEWYRLLSRALSHFDISNEDVKSSIDKLNAENIFYLDVDNKVVIYKPNVLKAIYYNGPLLEAIDLE